MSVVCGDEQLHDHDSLSTNQVERVGLWPVLSIITLCGKAVIQYKVMTAGFSASVKF